MEIDAEEFRDIMAEPSFKTIWGTLEGGSKDSAQRLFKRRPQHWFNQKESLPLYQALQR